MPLTVLKCKSKEALIILYFAGGAVFRDRIDADRLRMILEEVSYIPISWPYRYPNQPNFTSHTSRRAICRFELLRVIFIGSH